MKPFYFNMIDILRWFLPFEESQKNFNFFNTKK